MVDSALAVPAETQIRARIAWICQVLRAAAVIYPAWVACGVVSFWLDERTIRAAYPAESGLTSALTVHQKILGLCISAFLWLFVLSASISMWRLFSVYLRGQVFSAQAARLLCRVGAWGLAAVALDIAFRPILGWVLGTRSPMVLMRPDDLAFAMIFVGLLVLGRIYKAAAEIAAEYAQFV